MASSVPVHLDHSSLYICTVPLTTNAFHWSMVLVSSTGVQTRHHWATLTRDVNGREGYVSHQLLNGAQSQTDKSIILGYFKVVGYTPIDIAVFEDACRGVFTTSYPTVQENRGHGLTCRTWILHMISKLMSQQRAEEVEIRVKQKSAAQSNEYANSFLWRRPFMCIVEDV